MITLNTAYLRRLFHHCNRKYFGSKLPEPALKVSHGRTRLGQMACKRVPEKSIVTRTVRTFLGKSFTDYTISISDYFRLSDDELEDVMIHEMIHYSIAYTGLRDTSPHGTIFRGMMDNINRRYGRHIRVMTSVKGLKPRREQASRLCLVLAIKTSDGHCFLSSVDPHFASRLELQMRRSSVIAEHFWLESNEPFFQQMPRVRSLRGRRVPEDVYKKYALLSQHKR